MNMLANWQLVMLSQSEQGEFNPHTVHNNFLAPLWVICISLHQSIKINRINTYVL